MKPQDLVFVVVLAILLIIRKPRLLVFAGLICLILAIPLFSSWVFFTAQRLTYYAAGFFLVATIYNFFNSSKK